MQSVINQVFTIIICTSCSFYFPAICIQITFSNQKSGQQKLNVIEDCIVIDIMYEQATHVSCILCLTLSVLLRVKKL